MPIKNHFKMKNLLFVLLLFVAGTASSQNWLTDIDKAKQTALKENKPIILVFQGSDWCASCIKLNTEVWSTPEFIDYANEHFVMLKADFPKKKANALDPKQQEHNDKLAEKYNTGGYFPFVVVLDKFGKVLGTTGYKNVGPVEYIKILTAFVK
jgi:thioredoxin-related protein